MIISLCPMLFLSFSVCKLNMILLFTHEMQVASIKQEYDQAENELNAERSKLKDCDSQINHMTKEQQRLQQQLSDLNVEKKKMENEVIGCCKLSCIFLLLLLEQAFISEYDMIG